MLTATVLSAEKKLGGYVIRCAGATVALLVLLCLATPAALAQCPTLASPVSSWTAGNSVWSNGSNWSSGVPSSTTSACITNGTSGTPTTLTLDISGSTLDLQLGSYDTLNFNTGTSLSVYGTKIINAGQINVNGGGGLNTFLSLNNNVALSGGGTVTLSTTAGIEGGLAYLNQPDGAYTLTNVNNTIQGEGMIVINYYGGTINNQAIINANSTGGALTTTLSLYNGTVNNTGLLEATNSGVLQISGTTINNEAGGTILANSTGSPLAASLVIDYGTVTNNGTLQVNSGNLLHLHQGSLTNFSGNTLAGGTYNVFGTAGSPGTLQIDALGNSGGEIVNNAATILLDGPNSGFVDAAGLDALSNFNSNTATGSFTIQNGRNFTSPAGGFSNAGTVTVGNASTLTSSGGYTQSGGMTQGIGTIAGNATISAGAIQPGLPGAPGTLAITGTYNQPGGTFNELISSTANGLLSVTGAATLTGGTLEQPVLVGGFAPAVNQKFTILTGSTVTGTFSNTSTIETTGFKSGTNTEVWDIFYKPSSVILEATNADVTATWAPPTPSGQTGLWTTDSEWTCTDTPTTCMPNNTGPFTFEAVLNSLGNTLTLSAPGTTVNSLTLTAGNLDIKSGATLNLVNQPNGITDIATGVGLDVAGTFEVNGAGSALAKLGSVGGTLTLEGQTLTATPGTGTLTNTGTVNVQQTSALTVAGALTNSGTINTGNGVSDTGNNAVIVSGLLTNNGTITLAGTGDSLSADLTNAGAINLNGNKAKLTDSGDFNNNSGGSLSLNANLNSVSVAGNFTNASGASVTLAGTNGALSVTKAFSNGGTLTLSGTGDTVSAASFGNSGSATVGVGENMVVGNTYMQSTGSTSVTGTLSASTYQENGGTTTLATGGKISAPFNSAAGIVQGTGTISGNVAISGGTLIAGAPTTPGTLNITGNYTQTSAGVYNELIGNTANGVLNITGNATLNSGAQLDISLLGGYPANGTTFDILNYGGSETGTFHIDDPTFDSGTQQWKILSTTGGDIVLEAEAVTTAPTPVTATWNTISGNWTTLTEWGCTPGPATCVPNNNVTYTYTAVLDSPGKTLTLDNASSPTNVTISSLTLTAGTLDIGTGTSLNVLNNGLTDIPAGAGLIVAGTFTNGADNALAQLGSVEGTLTLQGQTLTATPGTGTLTNTGTMNVQQTSALTVAGALTNSGTINTGNGVSDTGNNAVIVSGLLTNNGTITLAGTGDSLSADLTNAGAINLNGNNAKLTDSGDFNNNSGGSLSLNANLNSVSVAGTFNNASGASVAMSGTNGSIVVGGKVVGPLFNNGTISLGGSDNSLTAVLTNAGPITLSGGSDNLNLYGEFNNNSGASLDVTGNNDIVSVNNDFNNKSGASITMSGTGGILSAGNGSTNGGTITLSGSGDTLSAPTLTNTGTVVIGPGETATFASPGTYNQAAGSTTVKGTLTAGGVSINGGSLLGAGTINTPIYGTMIKSGGSLQPASAPGIPGTLAINGPYTQLAGGTLTIDLAGTGDYSVLAVSGLATLGGTVDFTAIGGFKPATGDDFTFLTFGSESGNFSAMDLTGWSCPTGDTCTDVFGPGTLTLEITPSVTPPPHVPEPSPFLLLVMGIAMMTILLKYRNTVRSGVA